LDRTTQLRLYSIQEGRLQEFVDAWKAGVLPLRVKHRFTVDGAWILQGESRFVWLLSFPGTTEEWVAADGAYYASDERNALDPDPAKLIAGSEHWFVSPVALS
jgi:hypothetical protein